MTSTRHYKYYEFIMAAFCTVLLCSNMIGASKIVKIGSLPAFGAGILFFPISYVFGDVLTEVYGYARARKVVWAGFASMIFASFMSMVVIHLPPDASYQNQTALETIFGSTARITAASLVAFFCGEFTNSFVLAKMKIMTKGSFLWMRTIGSTICGELVDSLIFYPLAFWGIWDQQTIIKVLFMNYLLKVLVEIIMTPITYRVVGFLKKKENEDFYDYKTDFTPFSIKG